MLIIFHQIYSQFYTNGTSVYGNEVSDRKGPKKTIAIVEKKYIDFSIKYILLRLIPTWNS